jgi:hypothetical protein
MFTLDRTTLFFLSLSDEQRPRPSKDITGWITDVNHNKHAYESTRSNSLRVPTLVTSKSTSRSQISEAVSARSALTTDVQVKINDGGGLSDFDETRGGELDYARNSPKKGKQRLNSSVSHTYIYSFSHRLDYSTQALVVVKSESKDPKSKRSRPKPYSNKVIPAEIIEDSTWKNLVVSTMIRWAACQLNPWQIEDENILMALKVITNELYGDNFNFFESEDVRKKVIDLVSLT